jgi:hypothetical protein
MGIQEPQEVTAAALSQDVLDPQRLLVLKWEQLFLPFHVAQRDGDPPLLWRAEEARWLSIGSI